MTIYLGFDDEKQLQAALNKLVSNYIPAQAVSQDMVIVPDASGFAAMRGSTQIESHRVTLEFPRAEIPYISGR